jgi:thiamine-phosphate pyrophosphorylase
VSGEAVARGHLPRLYPIIDVDVCARAGWDPVALSRAYVSGGARWLQLRAKALESGAFLELADALVALTASAGARLIVNDRADIARLAAAAGVHVGQDDLCPTDVRRVAGDDVLVGLSTHTLDQIDAALREPIDYLAIGPVYTTGTKATGYDAVGLTAVRHAHEKARRTDCPVVAIGGVSLETARRVIDAGAASVAVITDLVSGDPEARVRQYLAAIA